MKIMTYRDNFLTPSIEEDEEEMEGMEEEEGPGEETAPEGEGTEEEETLE